MKRPRIADFDPDAKVPTLKSSLDDMPAIVKPPKKPETDMKNELHGGPGFFPGYRRERSSTLPDNQQGEKDIQKARGTPVPPPVPRPVPRTGTLMPKVPRPIRQRQPFDIYEDQYTKLKQIAEQERGFVNGRGMSQMVRKAIDDYLKEQSD